MFNTTTDASGSITREAATGIVNKTVAATSATVSVVSLGSETINVKQGGILSDYTFNVLRTAGTMDSQYTYYVGFTVDSGTEEVVLYNSSTGATSSTVSAAASNTIVVTLYVVSGTSGLDSDLGQPLTDVTFTFTAATVESAATTA